MENPKYISSLSEYLQAIEALKFHYPNARPLFKIQPVIHFCFVGYLTSLTHCCQVFYEVTSKNLKII